MRLGFYILISFLCVFYKLNAQSDTTVYLKEVEIFGLPINYLEVGSFVEKISMESGARSLSELRKKTAVFFREYGNNQLSTISLRGTSSTQTNVVWNGIPSNSPTLGQTDFSIVPVFFYDDILIRRGSGSTTMGSGAIGGSIIIDNEPFKKKTDLLIYSKMGSFGHFGLGVEMSFDEKKHYSKTRIFYDNIVNDFSYSRRGKKSRQPHASNGRFGISQINQYKGEKYNLFSEIAFFKNDREIQPAIASSSRDVLLTEALRGVLRSEIDLKQHSLTLTLGYVKDVTQFNYSERTASNSLYLQPSFVFKVGEKILSTSGVILSHYSIQSQNYTSRVKEIGLNIYSVWTYKVNSKIHTTIGVRETIVGEKNYFTPSFGLNLQLFDAEKIHSLLRTKWSKGYRLPTLNDRFWEPGGNPSLLAETSSNFEIGSDLEIKSIDLSLSTTAYISKLKNKIQWIPTSSFWVPKNIQSSFVKGVEIFLKFKKQFKSLATSYVLNYSFNRASDEPNKEKQATYIPKHTIQSRVLFNYQKISLAMIGIFDGKRFTTSDNSEEGALLPYFLMDTQISISDAFRSKLKINFSLNNIFNTSYENMTNRAMPGRNFLIELFFKLNTTQ